MQNKKEVRKSKLKRGIVLYVLFLIVSITCTVFVWRLNVLPMLYFVIMVVAVIILNFILQHLTLSKKNGKYIVGCILTVIFLLLFGVGIFFQSKMLSFLNEIVEKNYHLESYYVVTLKKYNLNTLKDLGNEPLAVGEYADEEVKEVTKKINKKIDSKIEKKESSELLDLLLDEDYKAVIIHESDMQVLKMTSETFLENHVVLETIELKVKITDTSSHVDITKKSFNIYVTGVDTYGRITGSARSDVNMVLTINPNTNQVLITSIPRDYYIDLAGYNSKDKITHSGIYGIAATEQSVEKLLDIEINYYVKFNFNALVKLVDALGGITVENPTAFTANFIDEQDNYKTVNYSYKKGTIQLNGKQALAFVRERKAFALGDRKRVENQQLVLQAVLNKLNASNMISKYNELLEIISDNFVTNMPVKNITSFVKHQIKNMPSWNIESQVMDGTDGSEYTYTYKKSKTYVMLPKADSVNETKTKIKEVMGE